MAILYYDDKKLFQLNTEKTTYVMKTFHFAFAFEDLIGIKMDPLRKTARFLRKR